MTGSDEATRGEKLVFSPELLRLREASTIELRQLLRQKDTVILATAELQRRMIANRRGNLTPSIATSQAVAATLERFFGENSEPITEENLETIDERIKAYFLRVRKNVVISAMRKKSAEKRTPKHGDDVIQKETGSIPDFRSPSHPHVEDREIAELILDIVRGLGEDTEIIFFLRYNSGFSFDSIARVFSSLSSSSVKRKHSKALELIRIRLTGLSEQ